MLAIRIIDFGDATPDRWKSLGCNLDGVVSDTSSTNVCKPVLGANPASVKTDANGGTDNSFGENLLPVLVGLASDYAHFANDLIDRGGPTLLLVLDGIGEGSSYFPVNAKTYTASTASVPPAWDGAGTRSVTFESVINGSASAPLVAWTGSYVTDRQWAASPPSAEPLLLPLLSWGDPTVDPKAAAVLWFPIRHSHIDMRLAVGGTAAFEGRISGVIDTEELVLKLQQASWKIAHGACMLNDGGGILDQIRQMSDILKDGTQDPGKTCDGISIGLGFTATAVKLGAVAPPDPPAADPCAEPVDAGDGG